MRCIAILVSATALFPFVAAQDDFPIQLAAIEAHFKQSQLVPELISTFEPTALLNVDFPGAGKIDPGQLLTQEASGAEPILTILAPEGVDLNGTYTVVLADPGAVGASTAEGVTRHMLVNGARVGANGTLDLSGGVSITRYAGPAPPEDGPHRYTFLVYTQPENFAAPEGFSTPNMGVSAFDLNAYAQSAKLGPIIAGNYFTVLNGQAPANLPVTSPVDTAALSIPAPTSTNNVTGTSAANSTGSATGSASSSTNTNSATSIVASPLFALAVSFLMVTA